MPHINVEIKARCADQNRIREILHARQAEFRGLDHQIDTYFKVPHGRLKLREGNIEHALIHYERENIAGPKQSNVILYRPAPDAALKAILTKSLGIACIVEKQREIFFIENVKFHLDAVAGLGTFVEIEAIDFQGDLGSAKLYEQCQFYLELFGICEKDLVKNSYSDLIGLQ